MFGLTLSGFVVTLVLCFYFRHVFKTVADAAEDAVISMTDASSEQIAGYAVSLTRDAITDSQDAIRELQALDANPDIVRPSEYLREQRRNRKNRNRATTTN